MQDQNINNASLAYNLGRTLGFFLLIIVFTAIIITPVNILTSQTKSFQMLNILIFAIALTYFEAMISQPSDLLTPLKIFLMSTPFLWLGIMWFFIAPQLPINVMNNAQALATQTPIIVSTPASSSSATPEEVAPISVALITANASIVVAIIGLIGMIITAIVSLQNAKITSKKQ